MADRIVMEVARYRPETDSEPVFQSYDVPLTREWAVLDGVPYAIAPDVQTRVPMLMWLSDGFAAGRGIDLACLRQRATQPADHA